MAAADSRAEIYKEASQLAAEVGPAAKHYVRVMEKVVNGTEDYVSKESKRCVFSGSFFTSRAMPIFTLDTHALNLFVMGLSPALFRCYCRNVC